MRSFLRVLLSTVALAVPSAAEAEGAEVKRAASLQWVRMPGAEDCADGAALSRTVEQKLGAKVFPSPRLAQLLIEGSATKTPEGYRAELRMFEASGALLGTREVLSAQSSCAELSEAVALVLAVMIDPDGVLAAEAKAAETAAPPPPPPPPVPAIAPAPPAPLRRPAAHVFAFARAAYAAVPTVLLGAGAALELRLPRFGGVRAAFTAYADHDERASALPSAGARFRVLTGEASYCPAWFEHGRARVAACGGIAAGVIDSRGFGLPRNEDTQDPLVDALASVRFSLRLAGPFTLYAGSALSVPLVRTQFEVRLEDGTAERLFDQPALGGELDLGLGARF